MIDERFSEAKAALDQINKVEKNIKTEYRSLAEKIPVMLTTNGLIQTILFLQDKKEKSNCHQAYYNFLSEIDNKITNTDEIMKLSVKDYRQLSQKLLNHCEWVKKIAKAEFPREQGGAS